MSTIAFGAPIADIRSAASAKRAGSPASTGSPATARTRLRITSRGRAVLLALVSVPLSAVLLVLALNGGGAIATLDAAAPAQIVMVQPGQSLWSLAESIAPNDDPRDVILELVAFNRLESADVWAGQQISIPQQYASTAP